MHAATSLHVHVTGLPAASHSGQGSWTPCSLAPAPPQEARAIQFAQFGGDSYLDLLEESRKGWSTQDSSVYPAKELAIGAMQLENH